MIVENKQHSIEKANEISAKLLKMIGEECAKAGKEDDPAENIYLMLHTVAILSAKVCLVLEEYGKIYAIDKLDSKTIHSWMLKTTKEALEWNKPKEEQG